MKGFTIIELLIAMTITLLIAGAIAGVTPSARAAFERVPADLDLQQRGRAAIDVLSHTLRSAGRNVAATESIGTLGELLPAVSVSGEDESGAFTEITAIIPVTDAAQGILAADQSTPGGAITLATDRCPNVKDVCGFAAGSIAAIADGAGLFDVFQVSSTNAGARRLTPAIALSRSYPAGSVLVEVDRFTFNLAEQPDGSYSLVRTTAAGAVQPLVDFVNGLSFEVIGGTVDVWLSVEASSEALRRVVPDRVFRASITLRNAS